MKFILEKNKRKNPHAFLSFSMRNIWKLVFLSQQKKMQTYRQIFINHCGWIMIFKFKMIFLEAFQLKIMKNSFKQYNNIFIQVMLLKYQAHISLKQEINKINCLSTAYDNTYVLSIVVKPGKTDSIIHINSNGQTLYRHDYDSEIGNFAMLRDKQIIVLNVKKSTIDIINLQSKFVYEVNHNFMLEDADQMQIFTFSDTKYFCILEQQGSGPGDRFKMTYYNYNTIFSEQNPISTYQQTIEENGVIKIVKANDHSKMAYFQQNQSQVIELHTWDLKSMYTGTYNLVSIRNKLGANYQIEDFSITIHNLWEVKDDIYTLVCGSNRKSEDILLVNKQMKDVINNNYILDVKLGTIRQTRYIFFDKQSHSFWNDRITETFYLGNHSVFHMAHSVQNLNTVPVFYVDNEKQSIALIDRWDHSCYANFYVPGYDGSKLILAEYDNGDVREIHLTIKRLAEMKEVALHFILHINEDFDDDLLQDALELLDVIQ